MTVRELIERLQQMPPNKVVCFHNIPFHRRDEVHLSYQCEVGTAIEVRGIHWVKGTKLIAGDYVELVPHNLGEPNEQD